jgi:hypothetical protein
MNKSKSHHHFSSKQIKTNKGINIVSKLNMEKV